MSQSADLSRPSKTKPADRVDGGYRPSLGRSLSEPLTDRDGVRLRREVVEQTAEGAHALSWREGTRRWRDYVRESRETSQVFMNDETGAVVEGGYANRFTEDYALREYAKLKDLERGVRAEYGRLLTTVMVTLTASSTGEEGEPLPPVDHVDNLLEGYDPAVRALRRSLEGYEFEYLAILEPHKSGYIHVHLAVFVRGLVRREMFAPVVDAHLRNCDLAGRDAHSLEDDSTVSVNRVGARRGEDVLENLASYLAAYLGTFGGDALEAPDEVQAANAVLWATGRRRRRVSDGAQRFMRTVQSEESTPWAFVGIRDGEGELHEVPEDGGGGVRTWETWTADRGPPPPEVVGVEWPRQRRL